MGAKSKDVDVSLEEMSGRLGLSAQRLGQIEAAAFRKMRLLIAESGEFPMLASMFSSDTFDKYRASDARTVERHRLASQKSVQHNRLQRQRAQVK